MRSPGAAVRIADLGHQRGMWGSWSAYDVGVALLRAGQAELVTRERRAQGEHFGNHFLDRVALEDPRVEAVLQHREPRVEGCGIARHAAVAADAGKACEVAGYVARAAFGRFDFDADVLAQHRLQRHAGVFSAISPGPVLK
ncbi:hypothetical protein D3C81_584930 [compost metagenome]